MRSKEPFNVVSSSFRASGSFVFTARLCALLVLVSMLLFVPVPYL